MRAFLHAGTHLFGSLLMTGAGFFVYKTFFAEV